MTELQIFDVLLIHKVGSAVDTDFEYRGKTLPTIGDVIELVRASDFAGHALTTPRRIQARVTGIEPGKSRPIRATEL